MIGFIDKELKSIIKKSHVLPKAHKELAKDNPVVLLNEGSCSGAVSKASMAHNDPQGTIQQTSGCDHKGKVHMD